MVQITETVLRDGHQSLIATRMRTRHMLPAAERLDAVGYRSIEAWGGATFDVCVRYLHEDPWERLRSLKRKIRKTPIQMLLRGQNLVGYRHYADDIVDRFVRRAATEGVDIFRVFDALNDPRNMERALRAVRAAGARAQGTICYTQSPVHTLDAFVQLGKTLAALGADELCIKDMGGFMPPSDAASLVRALVHEVGLPVVVHTHSSSGMSAMACMAAADAGATAVDSALSPFAGGTSQPPTESLVGAFRAGPHDPHLDLGQLAELSEYFQGVLAHYRPMLDLRSLQTDPGILVHQVPGGMLSNLLSQLKEQDQLARLPDVLAEIPRVRADLGYPPLVTPTSQIVGAQAVVNVLVGARYRQVTREVHDYVRGLYGTPPGPVDPTLRAQVLAGAAAVSGRPADLLSPEYDRMLTEVRSIMPAASEEEALSYAVFPTVYTAYRRAVDQGVTAETLDAVAAGLLVALRRPTASAPASVGPPAWARDGRTRQLNAGRWVREGHARPGR